MLLSSWTNDVRKASSMGVSDNGDGRIRMAILIGTNENNPLELGVNMRKLSYYFQTIPHCGSYLCLLIPLRKAKNHEIRSAFWVPVVEKTISLAAAGGHRHGHTY